MIIDNNVDGTDGSLPRDSDVSLLADVEISNQILADIDRYRHNGVTYDQQPIAVHVPDTEGYTELSQCTTGAEGTQLVN